MRKHLYVISGKFDQSLFKNDFLKFIKSMFI